MQRFHVVHLFTHSAVTRGGAVQGLLLARALHERGHRVECFFHAPWGREDRAWRESIAPYREAGLEVRRIDMKNPMSYLRFRRWLGRERVDILHAHRNLALLFGYHATLGLSGPRLLVNRGTTYPLSNPLVRRVFHSPRLAHVIVVARAVKQSLMETDGVDGGKISVVYGSFDRNRFHPGRDGSAVRRELGIDPGAPLIVCVAAVDRRKGLEYLIEAVGRVAERLPGVRLLLVGNIDDPAYHRGLCERIGDIDLADRVAFTGHRGDVPDVLAAADVSVNASTEGEGLTGALRESLAMEKPVVCTAVCGNPELVRAGDTGWLVAPADGEALARALLEALEHSEEACRRARAGRRLVLDLCSDEARCHRVEAIYAAVCGQGTTRSGR